MKEIISKKTGKIQIVSNEVWDNIVGRGWAKRFKVSDLPVRAMKEVPVINKPVEVLTKTKKKISNG
jgi:hypothetical protein